MTTLILSTATRYLLPLLLLFSIYLLLRGHDLPGGGFVGGLVASAAMALYAVAEGIEEARELLRINSFRVIGFGLLIAAGSACASLFKGLPFMTGLWSQGRVVVLEKLGTPFLFDVGVYLVVLGTVVTMIFSLMED